MRCDRENFSLPKGYQGTRIQRPSLGTRCVEQGIATLYVSGSLQVNAKLISVLRS